MKKIFFLFCFIILLTTPALAQTTLKEKDAAAISKYQSTKNNYQQSVNNYKSARLDWLTAKGKYLKNKNVEELTNQAIEKAQNFILKATDVIIKYLETIKTKLEVIEGLSEEDRQNALNELDNDLNWLESQKTIITEATTREELVNFALSIRARWENVRGSAKRIVGSILSAKINQVIENLENLVPKIEEKINLLKKDGQAADDLEEWLQDYQNKIEAAKENLAQAKSQFNQITSLTQADSFFRQGKQYLKGADQYLRQAHSTLKTIVAAFKTKRVGQKQVKGTGKLNYPADRAAGISPLKALSLG